ncbi:MAG TPA: DinB family protein [Capsulimonadaceae bacterium]|nr:DinB family protein [Capsulimonadaceae bacterium]
MELKTFAAYSTSAQTRLYKFLLDKPEACASTFETIASFKSIHDLLAHMIGAEESWCARILGEELPPRYEGRAPESVAAIYADWRAQRKITESILEGAGAAELSRSLAVTLRVIDAQLQLTVEQILFQIFNHENFHRAQCSLLLQMQGIDPPLFDFVVEYMAR